MAEYLVHTYSSEVVLESMLDMKACIVQTRRMGGIEKEYSCYGRDSE